MKEFFSFLEEKSSVSRVALCTIVKTYGSVPAPVGAKMAVCEDGKIKGTVGGGALEKAVIALALKQIRDGKSILTKHDLLHQYQMCCGGTVEIFIDVIQKKNNLFIFGAGHTGTALAEMAVKFQFNPFLIDDRKDYLNKDLFPGINKMPLPFLQALNMLPFDTETYICILTYSHQVDRDILAYCLSKPFAYLGMIGSQRKVLMTKKMFAELGISDSEKLQKVSMPIGLNIGAQTPPEIALSILAEMIAVQKGVPMNKDLPVFTTEAV